MRSLLVSIAVFASACSSEPKLAQNLDAGGFDARRDTHVACGAPGDVVDCTCEGGGAGSGLCGSDGVVAACTCPDAGGPADSSVGDLGVPADTIVLPDVTADADDGVADSTDAIADGGWKLEKTRCASGFPRLSWSDSAGCFDTGLGLDAGTVEGFKAGFLCEFVPATDGVPRCLPRAVTTIGGARQSGCSGLWLTTWTSEPVPSIVRVDGRGAGDVRVVPKPGPSGWLSITGCTTQLMAYPFEIPSKGTLEVTRWLAPSMFVPAP